MNKKWKEQAKSARTIKIGVGGFKVELLTNSAALLFAAFAFFHRVSFCSLTDLSIEAGIV